MTLRVAGPRGHWKNFQLLAVAVAAFALNDQNKPSSSGLKLTGVSLERDSSPDSELLGHPVADALGYLTQIDVPLLKMKSPFRRIALLTILTLVAMCALSSCTRNTVARLLATVGLSVTQVTAATPDDPTPSPPDMNFPPPGPGSPGGFGPGAMREAKLVAQFDKDAKGWLNNAERKAAREYLRDHPTGRPGMRRGPGGFRPPWAQRDDEAPASPGPKIFPADVENLTGVPLYASNVVRTLFLDFDDADWEKEMADFKHTDVEVPARLTVDGRSYPDVGVHFHGMSSFMMVGEGHKRSLVLTLDLVHPKQRLAGYAKLNLLNSHEDPSFLHTVLSMQIARDLIPAPYANFVRVVINGESWGIYVNQQHFTKDFIKERFGSAKGARWKVPGSPRGRGGLQYLGDDPEPYKRIYEIKSHDTANSWISLIQLCKALDETPATQLEKTLSPMLDLEGVLKFLAWENVLANDDGFYLRASDYDLFLDETGRFHVIPYDANETFSFGSGPGGPGGPRGPANLHGGGVKLDPLSSAEDESKPLLSKLLAVPALRQRYLEYVRDLAKRWLDWEKLGPIATQYHNLIAEYVAADSRKLYSQQAFENSLTAEIKKFADQRREFLLGHLKPE